MYTDVQIHFHEKHKLIVNPLTINNLKLTIKLIVSFIKNKI